MVPLRTCAHVRGNGGKLAKERAEAREVTLIVSQSVITQGKRGHMDGARACGRSGRWGVEGGRETAIWAVVVVVAGGTRGGRMSTNAPMNVPLRGARRRQSRGERR